LAAFDFAGLAAFAGEVDMLDMVRTYLASGHQKQKSRASARRYRDQAKSVIAAAVAGGAYGVAWQRDRSWRDV
jgi:hypothetical protein